MPSANEIAKGYAARISNAVALDQGYITKGLLKNASDLARGHVGTEIIAIGEQLRRYTEESQESIIDETADELGWNQPQALLRLTKGGSLDALLTMTQQLQSLFNAIKK